jgi:hypothetical protein
VSGSEDFIILAGGPIVPRPVVVLLLDLEQRGIDVELDGEDLAVTPAARLTDEDRQHIRQWKSHVRAVLAYVGQRMAVTVQ